MPPRFLPLPIRKHRGPLFWIRPANLWAGRRHWRPDHSNEWRYEHLRNAVAPRPPVEFPSDPSERTRPYQWLLDRPLNDGFSFIILGDTGEGDASQYALLPLIRALKPDFMIINGDIAYPAGNPEDYLAGFFEVYRNLRIPVWAVPGNHEYYSKGKGREFFDVFCSPVSAATWEEHGLASKPQPGSYWELAERDVPLVILGVDSGQSGALDGKPGRLGIGKRRPDVQQHAWLERRLLLAERRGAKVIVLFHIPKLVDARAQKIALDQVHMSLSRYSCVQLVVTAHIHNLQIYDVGTFGRFLRDVTKTAPVSRARYMVSGGGGAYIGSTAFTGPYMPQSYPDPKRFSELARAGQEIVAKLRVAKTLPGDLIANLGRHALASDGDQMRMVSLIHCECRRAGIRITPYYFDDLAALYPNLANGSPVSIEMGVPPLTPQAVSLCRVNPSFDL